MVVVIYGHPECACCTNQQSPYCDAGADPDELDQKRFWLPPES